MKTLPLTVAAFGLGLAACANLPRSLTMGAQGRVAACSIPLADSGCPANWIADYEAAPDEWTIVYGTVSIDGGRPVGKAETSTSLVKVRPDGRRIYSHEPYQTGYVRADGGYCVMVPRKVGHFHLSVHAFDIRGGAEWDPPLGGTHCNDVRFD